MKRVLWAAAIGALICAAVWGMARAATRTAPRSRIEYPTGARSIHVFKSRRILILRVEGRELFRAKIALGRSPVGHKFREGDGKTPEGKYYVCTRNERSRFHLFLGLSYPGIEDAAGGRARGTIGESQEWRIEEAIRGGRCPPWDTPLGGAVGIHGRGSVRDWTLGCIALEDEDVEVLWSNCPLGTPVIIEP
jgi:murein L,D-transpeptidase YafK